MMKKVSLAPLAQGPYRVDRWHKRAEWHKCLLILLAAMPSGAFKLEQKEANSRPQQNGLAG